MLQLPVARQTEERALYNLRMCEYDIDADHERIVRLLMRRAQPNRLGLQGPAVLEISEHDVSHAIIQEEPQPGLVRALLMPLRLADGGGR